MEKKILEKMRVNSMIRVSRLNDIPISKTEFDECNCLPYGLSELKSCGYIILLNLNLI
jgi:hypothetical protein